MTVLDRVELWLAYNDRVHIDGGPHSLVSRRDTGFLLSPSQDEGVVVELSHANLLARLKDRHIQIQFDYFREQMTVQIDLTDRPTNQCSALNGKLRSCKRSGG